MRDWMKDHFFHSFLYSCTLDEVDRAQVEEETLRLQSEKPSVSKSNFGGWQSEIYTSNTVSEKYSALRKLAGAVELACADALASELSREPLNLHANFWANVNDSGHYNALHHHGSVAACAIYYAKLPSDAANSLAFVRTDGAAYMAPAEMAFDTFSPNIEEGRVYIFSPHLFHYVQTVTGRRISLAFNTYFR